MCRHMRLRLHSPKIAGKPGVRTVIAAKRKLSPRVTYHERWSVTRIWTSLVPGVRSLNTEPSGFQPAYRLAGRLTGSDTGCGLNPGAGRGSTIQPGVLRPFITAGGPTSRKHGCGYLDGSSPGLFTLLHSWL